MTWHTSTTKPETLDRLLIEIRSQGGTVASCRRCTSGLVLTWFTR